MQKYTIEIGVKTSVLEDIYSGTKIIEGRLGKTKFLAIKENDVLKLREDIWKDGEIIRSIPSDIFVRVAHVFYFRSFFEMLSTLGYKSVLPSAESIADAIKIYRQFYSVEDETKYGIVAIQFKLI